MIFSRIKSLMVVLCLFGISLSAQIPQGYEKGLSTISKKELYESLSYLASDSLKGRPTGSPENLAAAKFIAEKFQSYGLKPLFQSARKVQKKESDDESKSDIQTESQSGLDLYFQKFNLEQSKINDNCTLSLIDKNGDNSITRSYSFKNDFLVQSFGSQCISAEAQIVFVGYGIDKGENGYSDYTDAQGKAIDVKNKIVVLLEGFPQERDPKSIFSKAKNPLYINPMRKIDLAFEKGAIAVLIVNSPFKNDPPVNIKYEKAIHNFERDNFSIPDLNKNEIPAFYVNNNVVDDILSGSNKNVKKICEEIDKTLKPASFTMQNKTLKFQVNYDVQFLKTQNVLGLVEGTDPVLKNEFIVIGAHYDHVGLGYHGAMFKKDIGRIFNGADDNASGTSGLIEIAEAFAKSPAKRSILFIAFTVEENAMMGSRYYVKDQPLLPLDKTVAMFNLDMVGRNDTDELYVGGAFYSSDLIKIAQRANEKVGFELFFNTGILTMGSDQAFFIRKEIPSLFFFSGMHDDYHTPEDKIEKINFDKTEKVAKLAFLSAWITANENEKPKYKEATVEERSEIVKESLNRHNEFISNKKKQNN
ncbi:MAG: M20/M25/M40 family metallo-hydrolase [Clostridiales bacterium]